MSMGGRSSSHPAPAVSIVVPTRDRVGSVGRLVDALTGQSAAPPFEVVVVDDGSRDSTVDDLARRSVSVPFQLTVLRSASSSGPGGARNRGWRAARGDRILFTDDDCVPDAGWVAALGGGLDGADVVVGRTKPPDDQRGRIGPFSSYLDIGHDGRFSTCNVGYRRSVLEKLGGFDEARFRYPNGEDTDLGLRAKEAGYSDAFVEAAVVWHDVHPSDFRTYFRRIRRLDGVVALVARHPDARRLMNAGWFLRSVDKAVLIVWTALLTAAARPRRTLPRLAVVAAAALYAWQFDRSYYRPRSTRERLVCMPLAFVGDSWAVMVMARSSLRWRTLLL
jgi:GT2 family glycosyltransferase